jgi:hypothetical protein
MASKKPVSQARLQQKTGTKASFGGYTKVQTPSGQFRMKPTGGKK